MNLVASTLFALVEEKIIYFDQKIDNLLIKKNCLENAINMMEHTFYSFHNITSG